MPSFSIAAQASLKDIIEEQQEASYPPSDYGTPQRSQVPSPPKPTMDQELLFEERFGRVMADNERLNREKNELQKMLRDLHDRLARLQENNASYT
ncbi:MAG: hypothetical protein MMC33_002631 [Icmadophila ericetorum]|nr:hypothetical protein [Icmadophila ericetorum]